MLGRFHLELALFGAVGTYINGSGIEFILSESNILAEGFMMGFLKGKYYNRCTRIHQLLANVLEKKVYECFLTTITIEEYDAFRNLMDNVPSDVNNLEEYLDNPTITHHMNMYENYLQLLIQGSHGPTAQYWAIYIYIINRIHRELQRCVEINSVKGYIDVLPVVLEVFFCAEQAKLC